MTEIMMRKVRAGDVGRNSYVLACVDQISEEELGLIPAKQDVFVEPKTKRNPVQHRYAWWLAELVAQSCDFLHDRDAAMEYLKIQARHVRWVVDQRTNFAFPIPKSISYASLSQAAFSRLLNRFIWLICHQIIPGMEEGDLRAQLEEAVAPNLIDSPPTAPY